MRELRDELEVPGDVVMFKGKSRKEWCDQIRDAMSVAEIYGAKNLSDLKERERVLVKEGLVALGLKPDF